MGEDIQNEMLDSYIEEHGENDPAYVLCETYKNGISNGHTEHFIECDFPAEYDRTGEIVKIALVSRKGNVLFGHAVE